MRANVQKICEDFIRNRDELRKAFKLVDMKMCVSAANILSSAGVVAEAEMLKPLRKIIKDKVSSISYLAGRSELSLIAELYLATDPEATMDKIINIYEIVKKICGRSPYVAMLSILLSRNIRVEEAAEIASRGKILYDAFKKKHPLITSERDSAFACILAMSEKTTEQLIDECETVHATLKNEFSNSCFPQVCASILCMTDGDQEEKIQRLIALFNMLKDCKKKYSKGHEMDVLAALTLTDKSIEELADTVIEIEAFLSEQKDYGVLSGFDEKRRLMNAAMLAAAAYADQRFTALNIMAAFIALAAQQDDDDASTAAVIASV